MTSENSPDRSGLTPGSVPVDAAAAVRRTPNPARDDGAGDAIPADCNRAGATPSTTPAPTPSDGLSTRQNRPPTVFTCGGCPARWDKHRIAHCSGCHLTFTGVTAFDQHRVGGTCAVPAAVGLVERDGGMWGAPPMPAEVAERLRQAGGLR